MVETKFAIYNNLLLFPPFLSWKRVYHIKILEVRKSYCSSNKALVVLTGVFLKVFMGLWLDCVSKSDLVKPYSICVWNRRDPVVLSSIEQISWIHGKLWWKFFTKWVLLQEPNKTDCKEWEVATQGWVLDIPGWDGSHNQVARLFEPTPSSN